MTDTNIYAGERVAKTLSFSATETEKSFKIHNRRRGGVFLIAGFSRIPNWANPVTLTITGKDKDANVIFASEALSGNGYWGISHLNGLSVLDVPCPGEEALEIILTLSGVPGSSGEVSLVFFSSSRAGGGAGKGFKTKKTKLAITGTIAGNTNLSTITGGVNYTHSGKAGKLLTSSVLFESAIFVQIELNGVRQDKSDDIVWVNSNTFQLNNFVNLGDKITIFS